MSNSFFRRTASAAALLLAAGGMHVPLLAAVTTHPVATSKVIVDGTGRVLHGNAAHRLLMGQKIKEPKMVQTPFARIMAPKIKADQAKRDAVKKLNGAFAVARPASPPASNGGLIGSNGQPVNVPGFFHPSLITTISDANDQDVDQAVTADVNKDGKPDLITIQSDGTINVLLNTGTGLPTAPSSTNTSLSSSHIDFVSAVDLNGDGYPDLELVDGSDGYVYILLNNGASGNGTFGTATQITLPLPSGNAVQFSDSYGGDVIFADITGDGKPDMVVLSGQYPNSTDTSLTVQLFAGVGDGTFPTVTQSETSTVHNFQVTGSFHSLQAVDMNGDGQLDLVFPATLQASIPPPPAVPPVSPASSVHPNVPDNSFDYTYVLTGNNLGIFSPFADDTTSASAGAFALNSGDYIFGSYVGKVSNSSSPTVVMVGEVATYTEVSNGDGTLQPAVVSAIYSDQFEDVRIGDVTGDGKVDIVAYGDGYLTVYPGNGDGTFNVNSSSQMIMGYSTYQAAQPADFNGDGIVDIVGVNDYASAGIYLGLAGGGFKGAPVIAPPGEEAYDVSAILTGNITGKGFADVLAYDYNGEQTALVTAVNDGKGNFTYQPAIAGATLAPLGTWYVEPVTLDIDNNGTQDLLLSTSTGFYEALSNGDGSFAAPVQIALGGTLACAVNYAAVGDLNGDGKKDVVLAYGGCESGDFNQSGYFTLINNGDGTFTPSFSAIGNHFYSLSLADFNNDGNLDLVALDASEGDLVDIISGNGDGTFNLGAYRTVFGGELYGALTGDFNGDGNQDMLVYGNIGEGFGLGLLLGNGDLTFPESNFTPLGYTFFPYGAVAADFNGDGKLDIAIEGYTDSTYEYNAGIGIMVNLGSGNFSAPTLLPSIYADGESELGEATAILLGDFNSDGAPDFLATSYYTSGIFYNTGAISLALTTSTATATQDSSVTLTATLTPTVPGAQATGTVTFYDNGVAIGTVPVSGNVATLSLSTLPVGSNAITAVYSGDANYMGASSSANVNMTGVTVTALPAAFTMTTVSGGSLDLTVGQTGVATFSLTGNATFNGPITLACSGAPAGTSCTISPSTITLNGAQTATFTAVLDTTAPNNHFNATNSFPTWLKTTGGITLAGGLLLLWPSRRRRNLWTLLLVSTLGIGAMATLSGCSHKYSGTPAGTYTVNVTATAGSITQTGTIALTIHQ